MESSFHFVIHIGYNHKAHDSEPCNLQLFSLKFRLQFYAQIWTKIRSMLHAQENARATLHPSKEIFKEAR